jgi:hypothetical protein
MFVTIPKILHIYSFITLEIKTDQSEAAVPQRHKLSLSMTRGQIREEEV